MVQLARCMDDEAVDCVEREVCEKPCGSSGFPLAEGLPLRLAMEGDVVKIVGIEGRRGCHDRLAGLGLVVGSVVQVLKNPMCGKMVIRHDNVRLFLGGGMAQKIQVTALGKGTI
ncbi:FeoA family protein [Desulfatiferula olefinivorans]